MNFITNNNEGNLKEIFFNYMERADCIKIASAFFSDAETISGWLNRSKMVKLLISLRPPTDYYALLKIHSKANITIQFLGENFHSKFFIFYTKGKPFACIIGSSNFTAGGLHKNIETNAILEENKYLFEIEQHYEQLFDQSFSLQPTDLDKFKAVFDNYKRRTDKIRKEQIDFEKEILTNRTSRSAKVKISKEAKRYLTFCRIVTDIRQLVNGISEREYPKIPVHITIDHFWHWVKIIWSKEGRATPTVSNRDTAIPELFQEYCNWDKNNENYTRHMGRVSKTVFMNFLSELNIENLTSEKAREVYANLHSGGMRTRRFEGDKVFITENTIGQIRKSLKYLLYSTDEIDLRIHQMCKRDSPYRLKELSSSGVQELIGWVNPKKYPIRNKKADEALNLLGFTLS